MPRTIKPKILIVDDEVKNTKLLRGMLSTENYDIYENHSGEQAFDTVSAINPDLILLDVMMPGINGFDVCRTLKQAEATKVIPIVMVTALSESEHRIEALSAGADDFLSKPVDRTELVVRVKSLLRMKSYHDVLLVRNREIAEQNKQLRGLEKIKEGLVHMIIHDLNNPLMSIIGNLDLILLKGPPLSQEQIGRMTTCLSHCGELKNMILSLLEIHKIEEGNLKLDIEKTDIAKLIKEVVGQSDFIAKQNQVLLFANGIDTPCLIDFDKNLIRRVLANLLTNAIRHTPAGGRVEVKTDFPDTQKEIKLRVIDTGYGLAPEYHQKVFNKFEQVRLKRNGVTVGSSGIGLAFCKMAVEAHAGKIWVESEGEGKGATFQFTLPLKQPGKI